LLISLTNSITVSITIIACFFIIINHLPMGHATHLDQTFINLASHIL
jgi:hypothetical protein